MILFIRFLKIRLFSQYIGKGEGEGNDCIAIPLESQVQHGTIFLEENYMLYMHVPFTSDLFIYRDTH